MDEEKAALDDVWLVSFSEHDDRELTVPEIAHALHDGLVTADNLVWREGWSKWQRLGDTPSLTNALRRRRVNYGLGRASESAVDWTTAGSDGARKRGSSLTSTIIGLGGVDPALALEGPLEAPPPSSVDPADHALEPPPSSTMEVDSGQIIELGPVEVAASVTEPVVDMAHSPANGAERAANLQEAAAREAGAPEVGPSQVGPSQAGLVVGGAPQSVPAREAVSVPPLPPLLPSGPSARMPPRAEPPRTPAPRKNGSAKVMWLLSAAALLGTGLWWFSTQGGLGRAARSASPKPPAVESHAAAVVPLPAAVDPPVPVSEPDEPPSQSPPASQPRELARATRALKPELETPLTGVPAESAIVSSGAEFDAQAAITALSDAALEAGSCRRSGDPSGVAKVVVTFSPSGKATRVVVHGPPYAGTETGGCIAATLRRARVPEFAGERVSVTKKVVIH